MSIKATSVLCILAIWVAVVIAIVIEPSCWWSVFFAALATGALGSNAWRRLGLSRVVATAGIWGATGWAMAADADATWMSVMAFLATANIVFSSMRRSDILTGAAVAAAWVAAGAIAANDPGDTWVCVFALLTTAVLSGSHNRFRPVLAIVAWAVVAGIAVSQDDYAWLAPVAFAVVAIAGGFRPPIPRRIEWDLFDRDGDPEVTRAPGRSHGGFQ